MKSPDQIAVMVADNETLMRRALTSYINEASDMSVIGEASTHDSAVSLHSQLKPDVLVISLPPAHRNDVEAIRRIKLSNPNAKVLAITGDVPGVSAVAALKAGVQGFVTRDEEPAALIDGIRDVHSGSRVLSKSAAQDLIEFAIAAPEVTPCDELSPGECLSARELSVVRLLAEGMSNTQIAKELHVSEATVKMCFARIMNKWGVRTRVHVLIRAIRAGLVHYGRQETAGNLLA